jgi:hypothetical protein
VENECARADNVAGALAFVLRETEVRLEARDCARKD